MVKFKKLSGLPIGDEYDRVQCIPFSMSRAAYLTLNDLDDDAYEIVYIPAALNDGQFMFRLNADRSFMFAPRTDELEREGWKVFTFEGFDDDIYIIDIDHHTERVFGYDASKRQFFRVKMHLREHDARFVLYDKGYYLSDFLR